MPRQIVIDPEAHDEIADAFGWYEDQEIGLGDRFLLALKRALNQAAAQPEFYPLRFEDIRRISVRKFPYLIYFGHDDKRLYVHSVFHHSRHPSFLNRLKD